MFPIPPPPSYGKIIQREIRKVEVQLKLVATDEERLVDSFKILWPDGTPNDLARVLDLKVCVVAGERVPGHSGSHSSHQPTNNSQGVKKRDQREILAQMGPLEPTREDGGGSGGLGPGAGAAAGPAFNAAEFSQSVRGTLDSSAAMFSNLFRKKQ